MLRSQGENKMKTTFYSDNGARAYISAAALFMPTIAMMPFR